MTAISIRRSVFAFGLLALGGFSVLNLVAQTPAGGRQKVTFIALGADNQPIADLKAAQVELKIDGKPRPIQALEFVKLAGAAPGAAAAPAAPARPSAGSGVFDSPVPPPYGENAAAASSSAPGRTIMIVVDEESLRPGADRPMKDALEQFLGQLGPADRAGIVGIPKTTVKIDPTTNRSAFREAMAKLSGRLPPNRDNTQDRCHTRDALQDISTLLPSLGDGPTSVVVFSSGMVAASSDKGECELTSRIERVRQTASSSHAIVYVVLPETTAAQGELVGLQNLAGNVNSPLLNVGSSDAPLARVVRESGNFYVAEVDVVAADRDGKSHRVDLRVNAPGASVRSQTEVTFAKAAAATSGTKLAAKDMVKDGKSYSDLPIRVTGFVSRGTADKVRIIAMVMPVDPAVKFSSVSIGFFDPSNKGQNYNVPSDDMAKPQITAAVETPPGQIRVHAAAVDTNGRAGTADFSIDAQLIPAGTMKMSGLLLGAMGPNGMTPKMAFTDEAEAVVQFDLYGTTQASISYALELALTPDGPAIKTGDLQLGKTSEPDRYLALGKIDIKDLKPGDYVVRATFQIQDTPAAKAYRTLRKLQ